MDYVWGLLGLALGVILTLIIVRFLRPVRSLAGEVPHEVQLEAENARLAQQYEAYIDQLQKDHEEALVYTRNVTVNQSRAVLKGKMAEQMAPLLPGFEYLPADARFLGDPVDYVIFRGYSECKDRASGDDRLELVILDIKRGRSNLSYGQRQIAKAVAAGRVRFEVVRILPDGTIRRYDWSAQRPLFDVAEETERG